MTTSDDLAELRRRVGSIRFWYHTMELASGVVTPGQFDMRAAIQRLPWPDVRGKRCLDVATFDGFYAFELERRGAAEVVAIDLDDQADLDWLPREVPPGLKRGDEPVGDGFRLAREVLGSQVERVTLSVYDLDPRALGTFDVVVCGALLQHLRDPMGALLAMRSVCDGWLLSVEHVDVLSSLVWPGRPIQRLIGDKRTWAVPNIAGHQQMLRQTGFDVQRSTKVSFPMRFDARSLTMLWRLRHVRRLALWWLLTRSTDPPFSAVLATPSTELVASPLEEG